MIDEQSKKFITMTTPEQLARECAEKLFNLSDIQDICFTQDDKEECLDMFGTHIEAAITAALGEQQAEVAALKADRERLDWLGVNFRAYSFRFIDDVTMDGRYPCWVFWAPEIGKTEAKTLRQAIEIIEHGLAARAKEGK